MFAIIQAVGWPIWPLILASVIAVALIIERSFTLRRGRTGPAQTARTATPRAAPTAAPGSA